MRQVIIHPGENGWWVAEVPSLPGCITQGKTEAEVIENIRDAIDSWVEAAESIGQEVPEDRFDARICTV